MSAMASHIADVSIICSIICSGADQEKHQSSASMAFVRAIHKGPVTWKMFPFDDVIMTTNVSFKYRQNYVYDSTKCFV